MTLLSKLWGRFIRPLFLPMDKPNFEFVLRRQWHGGKTGWLKRCPMPTCPIARANKQQFLFRFAAWAYRRRRSIDLDMLSAYYELVTADTDSEFWLLGRRQHSVDSILQHLLYSKKFPLSE